MLALISLNRAFICVSASFTNNRTTRNGCTIPQVCLIRARSSDTTSRRNASDRLAYAFVKFLRFCADTFFARRYGHRAVVLETIAAVPGMVGGALQHLRSLRRMESDHGWIHTLLEEAENERMTC